VPTEVASIPSLWVGEECWNSSLDARLEAVAVSIQLEAVVAASSKSVRLQETLPMASLVVDPYEEHVT
jgi:hypothetical protein